MELKYRGVSYNSPLSAVEGVERGVTGQYRGQTVNFTYPRHVPAQPVLDLNYRGVSYRTTATGGVETAATIDRPVVEATPAIETRPALSTVPAALSRRAKMDEINRVHRDNIQRRLQHRLEVARAKGDQNLIQMLERELNQTI